MDHASDTGRQAVTARLRPLNLREPEPQAARRATAGAVARAIPRRAVRAVVLARMAWNGVMRSSVSQDAPSHPAEVLPPVEQRLMRLILLLRGMGDSNAIGTRALTACARRTLARLEQRAHPAVPGTVPIADWSEGMEALYEKHVRRQRPVVVRGLPAGAWRWSIEWLLREHGDAQVTLVDSGSASFDGRRLRDLEATAPNGGPLYLHNNVQVFLDAPERLEDVPLELLAGLVRREVPRTAALFASVKPGTGTLLHCANNLNTFLMIEGRKRWVLIDPTHLLLTYPFLSHENYYQLSLVRKDDASDTLPLYRFCPRAIVDLQPGDCLIVPAWWLHSVRNLDARTLAAAVRWPAFQPGELCTNFLFRFLAEAMPRKQPGFGGIHQEIVEDAGTAVGRASWGFRD